MNTSQSCAHTAVSGCPGPSLEKRSVGSGRLAIRFPSGGHAVSAVLIAALMTALTAIALPPGYAQDRVLAVTTDYATGSLATLAVSPPYAPACDLAPVCGDAVVRWFGGLIYVVNRYGCDNIQVVDPSTWTVLHEYSVGAGSNPQDIAVLSAERAYVSRYESNDLLEIHPATGAVLDTISLASFADADGLCEMHRLHVRGQRLFVEVQRMYRQAWPDPWIPAPPSLLVVINLLTRQIVDADPSQPGTQGIALAGTNPIAPIQEDLGTRKLLVPTAGQYGVLDAGGIERVDPVALQTEGFIITEDDLGGDLVDFAQWSATRAYAIVSLPGFQTALAAWDPSSGQPLEIVYNPGAYVLADLLAYPTGLLYLSDRDYFNPGVRVFNAATGALLAGPIFTCLPPNELIVLPGATSGTGDDDAAGLDRAALGLPRPNPARGPVRLEWRDPSGQPPTRLEVFAPDGRRVLSRELRIGLASDDVPWDGADASGRPVPAGVYLLRVWAGDRLAGARGVRIVR
jgi:hypothetical protein